MSDTPFYKKYTFWAVMVFTVLFTWGMIVNRAEAAEVRLGIGFGATNDNGWVAQEIMLMGEHWYGSVMFLNGDDVQPATKRWAAGYRVNWRRDMRVSPYMRLGAAYWEDIPIPLISEHVSFDMAVGIRFWQVAELEWQHNSTGGRKDFLGGHNSGNDIPFLGVAFAF